MFITEERFRTLFINFGRRDRVKGPLEYFSIQSGDLDVLPTSALYTPVILNAEGDLKFGPNTKTAEITIGHSVTVYRGTTLTIRCPNSATSRRIVLWSSRGKPITVGKARQDGDDIVITDIDRIFALLYTCTVRTARGSATADSKVTVLGTC